MSEFHKFTQVLVGVCIAFVVWWAIASVAGWF